MAAEIAIPASARGGTSRTSAPAARAPGISQAYARSVRLRCVSVRVVSPSRSPTVTRAPNRAWSARRSAATSAALAPPETSPAGRSHRPPKSRPARDGRAGARPHLRHGARDRERAPRPAAPRARELRGAPFPARGAGVAHRAPRARGRGLRGTPSPELHERLVEVARPIRRDEVARRAPRAAAATPARRLAVDAKSRARTRPRSRRPPRAGSAKAMLATAPAVYGPNPGSARSASSEAGQPAVARERRARRGEQVPGARVVAEAAPEREDLVLWRRRERRQRRESRDEPRVVRDHRRDLRLLQHHLREPDAVRVRAVLREAPRQARGGRRRTRRGGGGGARRGGRTGRARGAA